VSHWGKLLADVTALRDRILQTAEKADTDSLAKRAPGYLERLALLKGHRRNGRGR
jgi:hypothetical protein